MRDRLLRDPDLERDLRLLDLCRTAFQLLVTPCWQNVFTLFDTKPTHFQLNRFHDKPTGHLKKTTRYYISSLVIGLQQCNLNNDVTIYLPLITLFHRDNIQEVSTLPWSGSLSGSWSGARSWLVRLNQKNIINSIKTSFQSRQSYSQTDFGSLWSSKYIYYCML